MSLESYDRRTIVRRSDAALAVIGTAGCLNGRSSTDPIVTTTGDFGFDPETTTGEPGGSVT